ncbi:MAG: hypothetical protein QG597_1508 [Actinomycetota bacterium]|nr:hypothetical protein [Actinomycetota bacterium]
MVTLPRRSRARPSAAISCGGAAAPVAASRPVGVWQESGARAGTIWPLAVPGAPTCLGGANPIVEMACDGPYCQDMGCMSPDGSVIGGATDVSGHTPFSGLNGPTRAQTSY